MNIGTASALLPEVVGRHTRKELHFVDTLFIECWHQLASLLLAVT